MLPSCNKDISSSLCHVCQLDRHTRLPFRVSSSRASNKFDLIHCDLWTSPIVSISGYKYYLVILDDCSHYLWTFPLRLKSDTYDTLANFFSYVTTQFGATVKAVQCDNGRGTVKLRGVSGTTYSVRMGVESDSIAADCAFADSAPTVSVSCAAVQLSIH